MAQLDLHVECPGLVVYRGFHRAVQAFCQDLELGEDAHVEIILASDPRISEVHLEGTGVPGPTDCVAFPTDFPDLIGGPRLVGAFYMGVEEVRRNARTFGKSLSQEVAFVLAHGLLHLLGHEDSTPESQAAMFARQDAMIAALVAAEGRLPRLLGFRRTEP